MKILLQIRKKAKTLFDKMGSEKLKLNLLNALPYWMGSLLTGLVAVAYAKSFAWTEKGSQYLFHHFSYSFFLLTPCCFIAAWWLVRKFAVYARGSGIPQVIAAIELSTPKTVDKVGRLLGLKIILFKILSSLIMVLGGGAIGREGPTVQIAGSIFWKINQSLPAWWPKISKKNIIMTGAAAGLAAAFNTPLGGIVFAVEELTKTHISYFKTALFTGIIIAGLTAQALLGPYLYIGYPIVSNSSGYIIIPIVIVAAICGLVGSVMSKLMLILLNWKRKFIRNYQHITYLIVCSMIVVTLAIFVNEKVLGSGKDMMTKVLFTDNKYSPWWLACLRTIGPILSFTTGAAGGVFAPALSAGASFGSLMAGWFHLSGADTNLLILAGMVGFLTGVTHTPFTSAILILEMTDRHNIIFQLMLAGMIASAAALLVDKHSFYDRLRDQYFQDLMHPNKKENLFPSSA